MPIFQMSPGRNQDAADYSALRNGYVSCIEVNVPLTESPAEHGRVSTHDAWADQLHQLGVSEPDISELVSRWNIFPQMESGATAESADSHAGSGSRHAANGEPRSENTAENGETSASHTPLHTRVTEKGVDIDGLLPEKILLLPYDVLHRLHKSHLAQLDELWALRALRQRRQLNVQKWPYLKDKLSETRRQAAELSESFSQMEELSSSLCRQQFGTRVKKLKRTTEVAKDLALKCRMAQARKHLLGRLARQLSSDAFAGAASTLAVAFDVNNHESVAWNERVSRSVREAVLKEAPKEITNCCASWNADNEELVLYFSNAPLSFESEFAASSRFAPIVEEGIQIGLGNKLDSLRVSVKTSSWLNTAEIETPLDLDSLGIQFHGFHGSALIIDWVKPSRWADVFGLRLDDIVISVNHCSTAEMLSVTPCHSQGGLKLCVARAGDTHG